MSETTQAMFAVGDRVRFGEPVGESRYWWSVRAADERYTVLTRQAQFRPKGEVFYTIVDRERGVRGPCNLIGQGWDKHMDDVAVAGLMDALRRHDTDSLEWPQVEVSYRNNVPTVIAEVAPIHADAMSAPVREGQK